MVAAKAVAPMFILIGIGMLVRKAGIVTREENRHFNRMAFLVFFSAMMFRNLYNAKLGEVLDGKLIAFVVVAVISVYLAAIFVVTRFEKDKKKAGATIQAIFRSNYVIMGIPLTANIFGAESEALAVATMMAAVTVPMFNILAIVELELFRGSKVTPGEILKQLVKNPLLMGAAAGLMVNLTGVTLPAMLESLINDMGVVATPLALVILGVSFDLSQLKSSGRDLTVAVLGRLIVVPGICLTLAAILGFRGPAFVTMVAAFATPCAVSSFVMAENLGSDGALAGSAVILSSMLSCLTLFGWLFLFKSLGMF